MVQQTSTHNTSPLKNTFCKLFISTCQCTETTQSMPTNFFPCFSFNRHHRNRVPYPVHSVSAAFYLLSTIPPVNTMLVGMPPTHSSECFCLYTNVVDVTVCISGERARTHVHNVSSTLSNGQPLHGSADAARLSPPPFPFLAACEPAHCGSHAPVGR